MRRLFQFFSLVLLLTSSLAAQDSTNRSTGSQSKDENAGSPEVIEPSETVPLAFRSYGVRLDQDGQLTGTTTTIDSNELELVPLANIDVIVVQQGRVVARARSDANGRFTLKDLTPRAVYSVMARSAGQTSNHLFSAFAIAVFPTAEPVAKVERGTQFARLVRKRAAINPNDIGDSLPITMVPGQDLAAVGLPATFADQAGQGFPLLPTPDGTAGGGGGGAGDGRAGLGAAATAATAAAAAAASANRQDNLASPFAP